MSDVLEQAKRLVDIDDRANDNFNGVRREEWEVHYMLMRDGRPFARALIETQKRLDEAVKLLRKWYEDGCEFCDGTGIVAVESDSGVECECAADVCVFLASIETKGDDE